jgi:two-component system, cell cycle response regulator DivK
MSGELILIVEDNEKNLKLVRDVLAYNGFATAEATCAADALAAASSRSPALILMDIQLPDMDGLKALNHLRDDPLTASIPVVALTAFAMKEDEQRFLDAGFDGYLAKPISVRDLPDQVRRLLEQGVSNRTPT